MEQVDPLVALLIAAPIVTWMAFSRGSLLIVPALAFAALWKFIAGREPGYPTWLSRRIERYRLKRLVRRWGLSNEDRDVVLAREWAASEPAPRR